jgi:hypothetical protein
VSMLGSPPGRGWLAVTGEGRGCQNRGVLTIGLVDLGVSDVRRAAEFWCKALGYEVREDGFGGWATVLVPPGVPGTKVALQCSQTVPQDHPRLYLDLHVANASQQAARSRPAWCRWELSGLTGTAIQTTRTSSRWPTRTAIVPALSTLAMSTADRR